MSSSLSRLATAAVALFLVGGATAQVGATSASESGPLTRGPANPVLRNDTPYDDLKTGPSAVVKVGPGDYRQWYEAIDYENKPSSKDFLSQTGYAVSTDGTNWTKKGIVFAPLPAPSWERSEACPTSMHWDGSKWILFYHGGNNANPRAIGRATSPTGTGNFTRAPNPILQRGATGTWDGGFVADAKVIAPWEGPDGLWRMYYIGRRTLSGEAQVGLATSADGLTFKKVGSNPVFGFGQPGQWDDANIQAFAPEWDAQQGIFRAWYVAGRTSGGGGNAGYAWSTDGVAWTRSPQNPVLTSISGDSVQDSIDAYLDVDRYRIVYGQYDLSATPPLRGKGEAFVLRSSEPPTSPPPTTTLAFRVLSGSDDGDVERGEAAYPPSGSAVSTSSSSWPTVSVRRSKASSSYQPVRVGLLRFDTSSLPDDATVVSAELQLHVTGVKASDGRSVVAEWYPGSAWPIDGSDWTVTDSNTAHAGTALSAIALGGGRSFALRNLGSIDLRGPTAFRLHISGSTSAPSGPNDFEFAAIDHPTAVEPQLIVQYTQSPPSPSQPPTAPTQTTSTITVATGADDGDVEKGAATYPPSGGGVSDSSSSWPTVLVRRSKASSSYQPVRVGLLRFDTSALPDDATVVSAELRMHVAGVKATDGRSLVAEWYPNSAWPIDDPDWTLTDSSTAHVGTALNAIAPGSERSLVLRNLGSIDLRGATALRLHISGSASAPSGPNDLELAADDHPTLSPPALVVTYSAPG